jgi:hypothetical protein
MKDGDITVNRDYQRSEKVWPVAARSFLIETILLRYPVPKLSLRQITDVKTRRTRKEIVDGQQRSQAIHDFYDGKFQVARKGAPDDISGRGYKDLDDEYKQRFLDYPLAIDLFVGASDEEIREVFRRINSYTVPLNAEEKRHATYQGDFKWFIHRVTSRYSQTLVDLGVFGERQLSRMQDTKLLAEITHSLLLGIQTTKERELNNFYQKYDERFPVEREIESRFKKAFDFLLSIKDIHGTSLMKPHQFYALMLAIMHSLSPAEALQKAFVREGPVKVNVPIVERNLSLLADALESDAKAFSDFVEAGAAKTNVGDQRKTRFVWYSKALDPLPLHAPGT